MNAQYLQTLLDESIQSVQVALLQDRDFGKATKPPARDTGPDMIKYLSTLNDEERVAHELQRRDYSGKTYTYLTRETFRPGDHVVVEASGEMKVALVCKIDEVPPITENDTVEYKWVIQGVNVQAYNERLQQESETIKKLKTMGRTHHRAMARQAILASYPELLGLGQASVAPPSAPSRSAADDLREALGADPFKTPLDKSDEVDYGF